MPAPRRRSRPRVQLNTKVPQELDERLRRFVETHEAVVQDVVEAALGEYLQRREG